MPQKLATYKRDFSEKPYQVDFILEIISEVKMVKENQKKLLWSDQHTRKGVSRSFSQDHRAGSILTEMICDQQFLPIWPTFHHHYIYCLATHSSKSSENPLSLRAEGGQRHPDLFSIGAVTTHEKFFDDKSSSAGRISYSNSLKNLSTSVFPSVWMLPEVATYGFLRMCSPVCTCTFTHACVCEHSLKDEKERTLSTGENWHWIPSTPVSLYRWCHLAGLTD